MVEIVVIVFSGAAVIEAVERYSGVVPFWTASTNHHDHISSRARPSQNDRPTWYGPLSVCLCLSVEQVELVSGMGASFHLSYTVLKGNSGIAKDKGTSLWNFAPNSGPRKFRFGVSIVETTKVDAPSMINWTIVSQLS